MPKISNYWKIITICILLNISSTFAATTLAAIPPEIANKVAISIWDASENRSVYQHNANKPMLLASNMKIITSYIALNKLGTSFYWPTQFAYSGTIENKTLNGDLYIIGGGDPTFTSPALSAALANLNSVGINKIHGDIIVDNSIFNSITTNSELHPEPFADYSVEANGLLIDNNLTKLAIIIKQNKIRIKGLLSDQYTLKNNLTLSKTNFPCYNPSSYINIDQINPKTIRLSGTIPASCNKHTLNINLLPNFIYDQQIISKALRQNHLKFDGKIREGFAAESANLIYTYKSESLPIIITQMNKFSNNTIAKSLFLSLGAYHSENDDTYQDSLKIYTQILQKNFSFPELKVENGAGLSRTEQLTTSHMVEILYRLYQEPSYQLFLNSLPTPGESGSLPSDFLIWRKKLFVKTGTLDDSKAYSGYFLAANGHTYIVSFIINNTKTTGTHPELTQFKEVMSQFLNALNKNKS